MPTPEIIYEDDFLCVVSKPQGMSSHPAPGARSGTLVQWLQAQFAARGETDRHVAIVGRLDRGTSGLVLIVTDPAAHPHLHGQVVRREIHREYTCLVWGKPLFEETLVDVPLGRNKVNLRRVMPYDVPDRDLARWDARTARTRFMVAQRFESMALLTARLETGRMHQIRAHCQYMRHPIVGDPIYGLSSVEHGDPDPLVQQTLTDPKLGPAIRALEWQCLHAGRLQFHHPITGQSIRLESPIPEPFAGLVKVLGR